MIKAFFLWFGGLRPESLVAARHALAEAGEMLTAQQVTTTLLRIEIKRLRDQINGMLDALADDGED